MSEIARLGSAEGPEIHALSFPGDSLTFCGECKAQVIHRVREGAMPHFVHLSGEACVPASPAGRRLPDDRPIEERPRRKDRPKVYAHKPIKGRGSPPLRAMRNVTSQPLSPRDLYDPNPLTREGTTYRYLDAHLIAWSEHKAAGDAA